MLGCFFCGREMGHRFETPTRCTEGRGVGNHQISTLHLLQFCSDLYQTFRFPSSWPCLINPARSVTQNLAFLLLPFQTQTPPSSSAFRDEIFVHFTKGWMFWSNIATVAPNLSGHHLGFKIHLEVRRTNCWRVTSDPLETCGYLRQRLLHMLNT